MQKPMDITLVEKIKNASDYYDIFYALVFDAYFRFEVDVDFDKDLRASAIDGLIYTAIKIIQETRGVEAALATLEHAKRDLTI